MKKRNETIDVAKGFAIICVVLGHVLGFNFYDSNDPNSVSSLHDFIYAFHMPLFIFLSGLVAKNCTDTGFLPFLYKNFRRLIIPFFVIGLAYSLFSGRGGTFILSPTKFGYWYLWVLFVCMALFGMISNFLFHDDKKIVRLLKLFLICSISILMFVAAKKIIPETLVNIFSLTQIFQYFPYFILGTYINKFEKFSSVFGNVYVVFGAMTIWILLNICPIDACKKIIAPFAIINIVGICNIIDVDNWKIKPIFSYLGCNSLYIYCFSFFFHWLLNLNIYNSMFGMYRTWYIDLMASIVPTFLVIAFALFVGKIIEHLKFVCRLLFYR